MPTITERLAAGEEWKDIAESLKKQLDAIPFTRRQREGIDHHFELFRQLFIRINA